MRKILIMAVIIITAFYFCLKEENKVLESRGIFITYIEYQKYFKNKNETEIQEEITKMIKNIKNNNLNRIYLHVSPFSDSIYDSKILPYSSSISGVEGKKLNIDVLKEFINVASSNNIEIYAWINPYRISNQTDINKLSKDNPAYKRLYTNNVKIIDNKGIYYNPASNDVRNLIISYVEELVTNYDINGLILDDYFYPDDTIDLAVYKEYKKEISIEEFRLNNVNMLIKGIYKKIKSINSKVLFGISPDGNIDNNYDLNYADIKTWLKEDNYLDFIMPQIYYGFYHETKPFIKTINEWSSLNIKNKQIIPALALYKTGKIDNYAKSGKEEWQKYSNIISKQIQVSRNLKNYGGFVLFRYENLLNENNDKNTQKEIENCLKLYEKK